jgi:uncharacterized DUF497 family protein
VTFEWDPNKEVRNREKHGVSFLEALTAFDDESAWIVDDPDHSISERRELLIGMSNESRLMFISFTQRKDATRIISARKAGKRERLDYEKNKSTKN